MMLKCPYCGVTVATENINMQRLAALCQDCDHVFEFGDNIPSRKAKPRKIEQPPRLRLLQDDDNRLEMTHRWVFSLGDKVGFGISVFISFVLTAVFIAALNDPTAPFLIRALFGILAPVFWYMVAVFASTTTRVIADEELLTTKNGPLPFPFHDNKTLNWEEITGIFCEETSESQQAGGIDRYYHVWVELEGGKRLAIQKSLPEDYAFYIAQRLEAFVLFEEDDEAVAVPLIAPGDEFDDEADFPDVDSLADLEEQPPQPDTQTR